MIKKEDIEYIANLSKIELSSEEKKKMGKELLEVLLYIEKLKEIQGSEAVFAGHHSSSENALREDVSEEFSFKEDIIDLFPEKEGKFLKVKSIL